MIVRLFCPDPVLFWAYMLPILYWAYLTLTTNFILVFDSDSYYYLGHLFFDGQWKQYFQNGPNREPLYPLMIAASMLTGKWLGISYTYTLKMICFGFLAATMIIIQQALKVLKTNRWVQAAAILYTGFSPCLINSALCLYSEISTIPWLVGAVLSGIYFLRSLREESQNSFPAVSLGLCLLGFTFAKGIGEGLSPLFLSWLLGYAWRRSGLKIFSFLRQKRSKVLALLLVFYIPLFGFKSLNYAYNGHFSVTNRAELAIYGPLVLRAQSPLTLENTLIHLSTVPLSYTLCSNYFPDDKCNAWYRAPADFYVDNQAQLNNKDLTAAQNERIFHQAIVHVFLSHPVRQIVYFFQEGLKMFFWETTRAPFVVYPQGLESLFYDHSVVLLMSLGAGTFCLIGFITACFLLKNELILVTLVLTCILIFLYSFFSIIDRYAILAGPLMILINASCLSVVATKLSERRGSKKPGHIDFS